MEHLSAVDDRLVRVTRPRLDQVPATLQAGEISTTVVVGNPWLWAAAVAAYRADAAADADPRWSGWCSIGLTETLWFCSWIPCED